MEKNSNKDTGAGVGRAPHVNVRLDAATYDRLKLEALMKGKSATALSTEILEEGVNRLWPECRERMQEYYGKENK